MSRPLRPARFWLRAAAALALALCALASAAQEVAEPPEAALARWDARLEAALSVIDVDAPDPALRAARDGLEVERSAARALLAAQRQRVDQLRRQLDALGPPPAEGQIEVASIAELRAELAERIAAEEGAAGAIQLAETRLGQGIETLTVAARDRMRSRLLTRGATPLDPVTWWVASQDAARAALAISREATARLSDPAMRAAAADRAPEAALAVLFALGLLSVAHRRAGDWTRRATAAEGLSRGALIALGVAATLARLLGPLAGLALLGWAVRAGDLLGPAGEALVGGLGLGLLWVVATHAVTAAFYAPEAPALRLSSLDDKGARRARGAAMALAWVLAADIALDGALEVLALDDRSFVAVNFLLVLAGAAAFWRLKRTYERDAAREEPEAGEAQPALPGADPEDDPRSLQRQIGWMLRRAAGLTALAAPALSLAGYYAASRELLFPAAQSALVLGAAALLQALVREAVGAALGPGRTARLLPILSGAALFLLCLPLIAVIWGAQWGDLADVGRLAVEGFSVGGSTFRPLDALFFAAVFAIGYGLTRLLQRVLRVSILPQMGVTEGSQSALVSGIGYVGVFIASLVAISATGLDLSNLAIVAGALSVGVGFGLQTIVNNFVSGIILLVERPIKVGDWIEANGIHGTVRKVNVRSTMIETFDRSTYIVPNSQLVAQPVTNFTHSNLMGRLIVAVRVTRDVDPRQVERILMEIGQRHPMVLRRPAPLVLFFDFGPGGTFDFELRVILRDVNLRLDVGSEIRFAIAERFREAGIAFAHPQQDVWIRGGEGGRAEGAVAGAGAGPAPVTPLAAAGRP